MKKQVKVFFWYESAACIYGPYQSLTSRAAVMIAKLCDQFHADHKWHLSSLYSLALTSVISTTLGNIRMGRIFIGIKAWYGSAQIVHVPSHDLITMSDWWKHGFKSEEVRAWGKWWMPYTLFWRIHIKSCSSAHHSPRLLISVLSFILIIQFYCTFFLSNKSLITIYLGQNHDVQDIRGRIELLRWTC